MKEEFEKINNLKKMRKEFDSIVKAERINNDLILKIVHDDISNMRGMSINENHFKDFEYNGMSISNTSGNINFMDSEYIESVKKYGKEEAFRRACLPQQIIRLSGFYLYNDNSKLNELKSLMFIACNL